MYHAFIQEPMFLSVRLVFFQVCLQAYTDVPQHSDILLSIDAPMVHCT